MLILSVSLTTQAIRNNDNNQKILALGFYLLYSVMVYNGLTAHGILPFAPRSEYIGPLLLGACLLVTLFRRYSKLSRGLETRSRELEALNANLEQIVTERTTALKTLNQAKDQFFAIIAHDLRSPIGANLNLMELYEQERVGIPPQDVTELRKNAQKTYDLLVQLLAWARGQQGQLITKKESISARDVVEKTLSTLREQATAKHINLHCISYDDPTVFADMEMLSTTIRNLVSNAIKFTPPGGWVKVEFSQETEYVRFTCNDNGIGLADDIIEGLFLPKDYDAIRTDTDGNKGSGLGLLLCQEFVKAHQGEIAAATHEAGGTSIWFTIPNN